MNGDAHIGAAGMFPSPLMGSFMASNVLYILHNSAWTDDRVADVVRSRGHTVTFVCPPEGDALPELDGYDALIVGGSDDGHADRPDELAWVAEEMAFIRKAVDSGFPMLGICMGAQMLACTYGGRVFARPDGFTEWGFYPVIATEEGRELFAGTTHFNQGHYEGVFVLPDNATLLARGEHFPVQAFRIGERAYGLQFHPDTKLATLTKTFLDNNSYRHFMGVQTTEEQMALGAHHEAQIQMWTERFVDQWIGSASNAVAAE
jgi:GMP synthase (glutamine-hydrolysing)